MHDADFKRNWRNIAARFLKIGGTAYGGPAIMGIMQAELQEKGRWVLVSKERFVEGLSLVNMSPGAAGTQLAIFLGHARGGLWGATLAGVCFMLPGFIMMMALTIAYAAIGVRSIMRGAPYGLGPVVLGIYVVAVYRLGRTAVGAVSQAFLAVAAAAAAAWSPVGIVAILMLAGGVEFWLFHSRRVGAIVLGALTVALVVLLYRVHSTSGPAPAVALDTTHAASVAQVGAFTFAAGLA